MKTGYELQDKYGGVTALHEKYLDYLFRGATPFDPEDIDDIAERAVSQYLLLAAQMERLIQAMEKHGSQD